ncbi:MAG: 16S rRNA (cytidine(1402)-2'-O)-methyltransferase [Desulfobacteraceae bacterium]|jgi:16S rRNA (cytidine1402-2'-O)-methyltransferase
MRDSEKIETKKNRKSLPCEARSPLHRGKIKNQESGILYVVSTPIGNLEDITLRALRILKEVDLIAAESVSHTRKLCRHHGLKTRLISYNQHNQRRRGPELIGRMKSGLDVALVTNAGTPGVSDPGALLINQAVEQGLRVSPIPGPSAVISALSVSGLRVERFLFLGFLSHSSTKRKKELKNLISEQRTMVFFEAPHRLKGMLMDLKDILGDRQVVLLREMTKVFEEIKRGLTSDLLKQLEPDNMKGEITLVVAGGEKRVDKGSVDRDTQKMIERLLKENNMSIKDMATRLSEEKGLPYRRLYKECLAMKKEMET